MSGHALQRKGQPQKHAHTDTHGHTGPRTGAGDVKDSQGSQGALGPCSQAGTGGVVCTPFSQADQLPSACPEAFSTGRPP